MEPGDPHVRDFHDVRCREFAVLPSISRRERAARSRVGRADQSHRGVTMIEFAEVNGGQTLTLWPRAASALTIAAGTPASTIVSSGSH